MTDHFHSSIDIMSRKLAPSCKNKKAQALLCDLLSDKCIELVNVPGIDSSIRNEQRTAQFNHMRIFISIAHFDGDLLHRRSISKRLLLCSHINLLIHVIPIDWIRLLKHQTAVALGREPEQHPRPCRKAQGVVPVV